MKITRQEFVRRRKALMALMEPNSIAILPSAPERVRSRDTDYPYRQDSDLAYLSGFPEPGAVLALLPGRAHGECVLFCREKDKAREIWDGYRAGPEGACRDYGADDAFPIDDIDEILPGLIEGRERVYYAMGKDHDFDRQVMDWVSSIRARVRSGAKPPGEFLDLNHCLHDMRLIKSAAELRLMRRAGEISARAHKRAMQHCRPGVMEYQLEAEILHEFGIAGARHPAYSTIVGGGRNACVLHYIENSDPLKKDDLVLIDAGCEYQGYAADITRTFPVSGRFTTEQRRLYELVLAAQRAAIAQVYPGNHWNAPHEVSVRILTEGLVELGLLQGDPSSLVEEGAYKVFYMHRVGHWLGMDVHDVGDYKIDGEWRLLEPGMVLTVEPGLYIAPDNEQVNKKWRGIGIRIEDDVAVTKDGCEILSAGAPKAPEDIEALMAQSQSTPIPVNKARIESGNLGEPPE